MHKLSPSPLVITKNEDGFKPYAFIIVYLFHSFVFNRSISSILFTPLADASPLHMVNLVNWIFDQIPYNPDNSPVLVEEP